MDDMMQRRLTDAGFSPDPFGGWTRIDDVYETVARRDTSRVWTVTTTNYEDGPGPRASSFRVTDDGRYIDGDVDADTAYAVLGELFTGLCERCRAELATHRYRFRRDDGAQLAGPFGPMCRNDIVHREGYRIDDEYTRALND